MLTRTPAPPPPPPPLTAIVVNVLIFCAKLWVHIISGSSAMLAEALHSVADVFNQVGHGAGEGTRAVLTTQLCEGV